MNMIDLRKYGPCESCAARSAAPPLAVDARLRVGLDSLGYPVVAGEDAAAAALRHLGAAGWTTRALDRLLDEHGGRGADETLPDAAKRVLAAKDAEIAGLRSDVRAAEQAYEHASGTIDGCYKVANAHGRRCGEPLADTFARLLKTADSEIIARGRRIEELRVAGESLATLMGQLSAAEADIATLTARAEKAEAEADRLRGNARTTQAHANIATCFGNGFVEAMEANGIPLHDRNPLGLRRVLATRAAIEARAEKAEAEAALLSKRRDEARAAIAAFYRYSFGHEARADAMGALDVIANVLLPELAQRREADGKPVDVEAAVEKAACDIADALDAVHAEWSAGAFRGKRDDMPPRAAAEARDFRDRVLAVLRSLARQAPSAAAKDEGERLRAGIDAALAEIEQEASGRRARARQFAAQLLPDYSAAVELDGNAYGFTRSAAIVRNHVDKP